MSDEIERKAIAILEREIRKACPDAKSVEVRFDEDEEQWLADVDGEIFVCQVGSDDDGFEFENADVEEGFHISLPSDWPV